MMLAQRNRQGRRGVALVEFVIVFHILILLLIGVWEVGRLIQVQQTVQNAAREGGRQTSTGKSTQAQVIQAVKNYITQAGFNSANVNVTITNLTSSSRSDPTQANQLDRFQVVVTMPFNDARMIAQTWFTGGRTIYGRATWLSMRDIPLAINSVVPVE